MASNDKIGVWPAVESLKELWEVFNKNTHKQLYSLDIHKDPTLDKNPIPPLDESLFEPVLVNNKPVIKKDVHATFYSDESDGTKWHGYGDALEGVFITHANRVAINASLYDPFPLGSYVKITHTNPKTKETRSAIGFITDNKGGPGIDLSKAIAGDLDFHGGDVTLQAYRPKDCQNNYGTTNPFARCYDDQVVIIWDRSDFTTKNRSYDRDRPDIWGFIYKQYELTYLMDKYARVDVNRPFIQFEHISAAKDPTVRWALLDGYYPSIEDAAAQVWTLCNPSAEDRSIRSPEDKAAIANYCSAVKIEVRDWAKTVRKIRYRRENNELPAKEVASAWFDSQMPDQAEESPFDRVEFRFKDTNTARAVLSNEFLQKAGTFKYIGKKDATLVYDLIPNGKYDNVDIELEVNDVSEKVNGFKYVFVINPDTLERIQDDLG